MLNLRRCCLGELEHLGDTAMNTEQYDDAISQYSAALSFNPVVPQGLFVKRSKGYVASGLYEDALNDANKVCICVMCKLVLLMEPLLGDHA